MRTRTWVCALRVLRVDSRVLPQIRDPIESHHCRRKCFLISSSKFSYSNLSWRGVFFSLSSSLFVGWEYFSLFRYQWFSAQVFWNLYEMPCFKHIGFTLLPSPMFFRCCCACVCFFFVRIFDIAAKINHIKAAKKRVNKGISVECNTSAIAEIERERESVNVICF